MQIRIDHPQENAIDISRRLGYAFQKHEGSEMAFVRSLSRSGFPRFHIYAKTENGAIILNIHLDQHKETYGTLRQAQDRKAQVTMHHGEYGNDGALSDEITRIKQVLGL